MILNITNRNTLMAMLAVVLFVIFDVAGLSLNYLLSWRIEQQAVGINLAGRQRMLSQRMVKTLLQIDNARRVGEDPAPYLGELKLTFDLFDNTLRGFDTGSQTWGGSGEKLFLPPAREPKARKVIAEAVGIWKDYRIQVLNLLSMGNDFDDAALQRALKEAKGSNLKLLALMNTLTTELENLTQREAQRIRVYQLLALMFALLCFVLAFLLFRRRDAEVMQAKQAARDAAREENEYVSGLVAHTIVALQTAENLQSLSRALFVSLAPALRIGRAACFRFDTETGSLQACGGYAQQGDSAARQRIELGEGLVGECAMERRAMVISNPPATYLKAHTALLTAQPQMILILPIINNEQLLGVLELALLEPLTPRNREVIDAVLPILALRMALVAGMSASP